MRIDDLDLAADAIADWINGAPCSDPAFYRALLNRISGQAVRGADGVDGEEALDRIGVIAGWGSNPDPLNTGDALDEIRKVLNAYVLERPL